MKYWIDGYNFLFRITKDYKTLRSQKSQILAHLESLASMLHLHLSLVFDGQHKAPTEAIRGHLRAIEIIYTHENQSADNYIIQHIEYLSRPSLVTVVSSDKEVLLKTRQLGAQTQTIEEFISFLLNKEKRRKKQIKPKASFRDTDFHINRLCKIFEERLQRED